MRVSTSDSFTGNKIGLGVDLLLRDVLFHLQWTIFFRAHHWIHALALDQDLAFRLVSRWDEEHSHDAAGKDSTETEQKRSLVPETNGE